MKSEDINPFETKVTEDNILQILSHYRIFDVNKKEGFFYFTEGCDNFFRVELSGEEVLMLAKALTNLANGVSYGS